MNYLKSSVGRKQLMGLTGLGLSLFVLMHMAGNLLILVGPKPYNLYSYSLISNPFIYVAETGLVALFLIHVYLGIKLSIENKKARGERYYFTTSGDKAVTFSSKTMIYHGLFLLVFTVYHLYHFKYGTYYSIEYDGIVMRDLHRLVVESFQSPIYTFWYVFIMFLLGLHLSHGVPSLFQSLGFYHPIYTRWLKVFGIFYAIIVALGFMAPPLYIFFNQ